MRLHGSSQKCLHGSDRIRLGFVLNELLSEIGRLAGNSETRPSPDRYERNLLSVFASIASDLLTFALSGMPGKAVIDGPFGTHDGRFNQRPFDPS